MGGIRGEIFCISYFAIVIWFAGSVCRVSSKLFIRIFGGLEM